MLHDDRAIVVLSGGQDSTTCLYWALARYREVVAVTFNYGQRHHQEIRASKVIAELAKVPHVLLEVQALQQIGDSALTGSQDLAPSGGLPDPHAPDGLPTSFVPGRNLVFLTLAASLAIKYEAKKVVTGVNAVDFSGYPDCRPDFIASAQRAIQEGTSQEVQLVTPLINITKVEIVHLAHDLGYPCCEALSWTVTCYNGERPGCGECPACRIRAKGFKDAGMIDPAVTRFKRD